MMNSTNKLSVIIPLYNAGDDFRTCMESLITQTWTALEIIIINDGSTDNSVEIAKHYAENYPHVRLLHQKETEIHAFPVLPLVMILFLPYNKTNSKKFGHAAAVCGRRNDEVNDEIHGD